MDDLLRALSDQHAELAAIIDRCDEADWARPTRCDGWDVLDVLVHLAGTDEYAAATTRNEFGDRADGFLGSGASQTVSVDDAAAAPVAMERAAGGDAARARWHAASRDMHAAFAASDPSRRVTWVTNRLSVHTLAATRLSECWIHTGDIASALDVDLPPTDRLFFIARLAWRTLPYAFARAGETMAGPVELDLTGPNGDAWPFLPDEPARTTIRGTAVEFCDVAARRIDARETSLAADGPDGDAVLRLVRTYAQ